MNLMLVKNGEPDPMCDVAEISALRDLYNTPVRVIHVGENRRGRIKGRSLPYWDTRTQRAGEQTYEVLLEGDDQLTSFKESEVYGV